ncbi:MAG: biopolymer transporter ExbD [Phycisphaerales bacterium]|nr:biopolymer transporter ExbD [Phycisphaerales bacterium]
MSEQTTQTNEYKRPRPLKQRNVLTRSSRFGPNMTPMVDVTLVILIFFMASASIAGHEWFLRADLPEIQDPDLINTGLTLPIPMLNADLFIQIEQVFVRGIGDEPQRIETVITKISEMDAESADGLILGIRANDQVPYWAVVALHDAASSVSMRVAIR